MTEPLNATHGIHPAIGSDDDVGDILSRARDAFAQQPSTSTNYWVTRSPACIDIAGGITEYSGAPILTAPLSDGINVSLQPRDDRTIALCGLEQFDSNGFVSLDLDWLSSASADEIRSAANGASWGVCSLGAVAAMIRQGKMNGSAHGATIVIESAIPFMADAGMGCATAVAVISALAEAMSVRCEPNESAQLAMMASNDVAGRPCGAAAAMSALFARERHVSQFCMKSLSELDPIEIPENIAFVAVHCGVKHDSATEKYARARAAAFMGRHVIDSVCKEYPTLVPGWSGMLSDLTVEDYAQNLRDRIPPKMKGADFVNRFGDHTDSLTTIEPTRIYKIRSRTEHHIYETERTRKFGNCLGLAARGTHPDQLLAAGECMYASHWSYGQRCGIGSVETDRLVSEIRKKDASESGIYGAKVSGEGSGGLVVVMMEKSDRAREALNEAVSHYESAMSNTTAIYEGTSRGLLEFGIRRV